MSLYVFYVIFFLKAVVLDVMPLVAEMIQHTFNGTGTAAKVFSCGFQRPETVFGNEFQDILQPLFIRSVIHKAPVSVRRGSEIRILSWILL